MGALIGERFDSSALDAAYRVDLEGDELVWTTRVEGKEVRLTSEPETSLWTRMTQGILRLLPIEPQL
jgi:putative cardiolipin synthase